MIFHSHFFETDAALVPLQEAKYYRDAARTAAPAVRPILREEMRIYARRAVAQARKNERARYV